MMNRSFAVACVLTVLALLASIFFAAPWNIASVVVASLSGAAALLLFLSGPSRRS